MVIGDLLFLFWNPQKYQFQYPEMSTIKNSRTDLGKGLLIQEWIYCAGFDYSADDLFGNITLEILGEWGMGIHIPWKRED